MRETTKTLIGIGVAARDDAVGRGPGRAIEACGRGARGIADPADAGREPVIERSARAVRDHGLDGPRVVLCGDGAERLADIAHGLVAHRHHEGHGGKGGVAHGVGRERERSRVMRHGPRRGWPRRAGWTRLNGLVSVAVPVSPPAHGQPSSPGTCGGAGDQILTEDTRRYRLGTGARHSGRMQLRRTGMAGAVCQSRI